MTRRAPAPTRARACAAWTGSAQRAWRGAPSTQSTTATVHRPFPSRAPSWLNRTPAHERLTRRAARPARARRPSSAAQAQPPPQTLQAPPEALGSPKKQNAAMRSMEPSPWTSPRPSPRPSPRRRIAPADDDEASSEEAYHDANPAFYTPAEDLEESELSLIGKLDAERTYLQVEREAYKLLKDEKNKSQPMKTAEEIVDDVLATNKEKLNTLLKMQREQRNGTGRGFLINSSRKQLDFSTKE